MPTDKSELELLRQQLADLTARVYALERAKSGSLDLTAAVAPKPPLAATPSAPSVAEPIAAALPSHTGPPPKAVRPPGAPTSQDLESKIGSQWLNRIGIVAVLIGVSYFLKYAFENNWIGPAGRIAIGLIAGIAVVFWSEAFRKRGHRAFSYSLKAVGVGVLYLSLWAAFQLYHLVPSGAAFAGMLLVTAFTAILALREDAEVIAAFAVAGGFSTPLLLATGENHEVALFSYLTILNLATIVLMALKPWRRLLVGSFAGTVVLYVGWFSRYYDSEQLTPTLTFATIFFGLFAAAPIIHKFFCEGAHQPQRATSRSIILITLLNPVVYFVRLWGILEHLPLRQQQSLLAWAAVAIAALYVALSRHLEPRNAAANAPRLLPLLHVAVAVGFLTVAVPLKLDAHWITIGWLIESGVLLWIGERTNTHLLRVLGAAALAMGVVRLIFFDNFRTSSLIFNARFATYCVAVAVLSALLYYAQKHPEWDGAAKLASIAINVLVLLAVTHEISDFFMRRMYPVGYDYRNPVVTQEWRELVIIRDFSYSALYMIYGAALMAIGFWKRSEFLRWQALVLIALTVLKVFVYDVSELEKAYRVLSFIALGVLLLGISFLYQRDWLKLSSAKAADPNASAKGTSAS